MKVKNKNNIKNVKRRKTSKTTKKRPDNKVNKSSNKEVILKNVESKLPKSKNLEQTMKNVEFYEKEIFPKTFPFWARLKIGKKRTTLVIDEDKAFNKKTKKFEDGFVDREATHSYRKDYEEISPNPDPDDSEPMYLKRPTKKPKRLFEPHNKNLNMPQNLKDRYEKNNRK